MAIWPSSPLFHWAGRMKMNDSNWTGRTDRTAREAYGHGIEFDHHSVHIGDMWVAAGAVFAAGFLLAMWIFG